MNDTSSNPTPPLTYSIVDTAQMLGVGRRTIERMVRDGQLRMICSGRVMRITSASIRQLLHAS